MNQFERDYHAKCLRQMRKLLNQGLSEPIQIKDELSPLELFHLPSALSIIGGMLICGLILMFFCKVAHAEITESQAVKIIVGEAANQGFKGMVCVAEVLRKQGSTKGFYGLNATHSHTEPKWVWAMAHKAWLASAKTNYTKLADHFENIHAFGCPYWVKKCVETFRYKDHIFYKEIV